MKSDDMRRAALLLRGYALLFEDNESIMLAQKISEEADRQSMPDPLSDALNSGDGTYRP